MYTSDFSHWIETAKNTCEILAIFGGATWTYLNYFRGRIYNPRLECSVEASIAKHSGHSFLRVSVRIRNIGLSKVPIKQRGTALLIYSMPLQGRTALFPRQVQWDEPVAAFDVFSGRKWVESSESIAEVLMVALPHGDSFTYKIALKVVSGEIWWTAESLVGDTKDNG
ncbi:MAG TPA: hypothetical protein VNX26_09520 [Candidatus Acidoferrum sp.]|nr:hypothetical protein [Candidatus Acidoferrum sp.]